jgi:hypothetical protein
MMDGVSRHAEEDFAAIEATVSATLRGRWFLAEYARRQRATDIGALMEAIGRIERAVAGRGGPETGPALRQGIAAMAEAVDDARRRSRTATPSGAADEPMREGLARQLQVATSTILDATERVQEAAWTLRESGADASVCDLLDGRATEIYRACETHGEVAAEAARALHLLGFLEEQIQDLREHLVPKDPPALRPGDARVGLEGDDLVFPPAEPDPAPAVSRAAPKAAEGPPLPYPRSFAEIDALDMRDKLRLFT